MTTLDHAAETTHSATRPVFASRVANMASNYIRAWKNRRAFYRLGDMSDAELADIGLTRSDLHVAIDLPFGSDPTARLRAIAQSRAQPMDLRARPVS